MRVLDIDARQRRKTIDDPQPRLKQLCVFNFLLLRANAGGKYPQATRAALFILLLRKSKIIYGKITLDLHYFLHIMLFVA